MKLRSYQREAVEAVLNGPKRTLGFAATGLGKTVIALELAKILGRTLFVSPSREITLQTARRAREYLPDWRVGIEMGHMTALPYADFVSATWQTLVRRLDQYRNVKFNLLVFDEAHHLHPYGECAKILYELKYDRLLLLTATPVRSDGVGFHHFVDDLAFSFTPKWGVDHGWLVPPMAQNIVYESPVSEEDAIVDVVLKDVEFPALAFVSSVSKIHETVDTLRNAGVNAYGVWGTQNRKDRKKIVEAFDCGVIDVLVAHNALTEGWDAPNCRSLIISRPTDSPIIYTQMIGRVLRPSVELSDEMGIDERRLAIEKSDKPVALIFDLIPRSVQPSLVTFVQFYDAAPVVEKKKREETEKEVEEKLYDVFELVATAPDRVERVRRFLDILSGVVIEDDIVWIPVSPGVVATYVEEDPLDVNDLPAVYFADEHEGSVVRVNLGGWVSRKRRPERRRVFVYRSEKPRNWIRRVVGEVAFKTRVTESLYSDIGIRPKTKVSLELYRKLRVAYKVMREAERLETITYV